MLKISAAIVRTDKERTMVTGIDPHPPSEPGYIVAWRSKKKFLAGKYLDDVITYGEACDKARQLSEAHPDMTFWAEPTPQHFEPH
jgi:hypothetical protein